MKGKFLKLFVVVIGLMVLITMMAGCSKNKVNAPESTSVKEETKKEEEPPKEDPLAKYEPKGDKTYEFSYLTMGYAPVKDDGEIVNLLNEKFKVKITSIFIDPNQWDELLNIKFASKEIPDVIVAKSQDRLSKYVGQNLLTPISMELLEKYAPNLVATINKQSDTAWNKAKVNGVLYGIPYLVDGNMFRDPIIWRKDWLEKVGITKTPETLQEFEDALVKFTKEDPDGNGKADTFGLSSSGFPAIFGACGVMNYTFQKDPGRTDAVFWKEKDGKLVHGAVQPETKEALAKLAKWYEMGLIDPEFITGENKGGYWAVSNDLVNGRIGYTSHGIYYHWHSAADTLIWGDGSNYGELKKINPAATIVFGNPPIGPDGKTRGIGQSQIATGVSYVFSKELEQDPEKLGKILQMFDYPAASIENYMLLNYGVQGKHWDNADVSGFNSPTMKEGFTDPVVYSEQGINQFFSNSDKDISGKLYAPVYDFHLKVGNNNFGVTNALM